MANLSFTDKSVIVTGAAAGIGKAIAQAFLDNDANVLLVDFDAALLNKTCSELDNGKVASFVADMSTAPQVQHDIVAAALAKFGRIDVLVNNAGVYPSKMAIDIAVEDWDEIFNLNVRGYFFMAQQVAKHMMNSGISGNIINISSTASIMARPGVTHYCATKAAVKMMTQVLALEWADKNIRVNSVAPGLIETEALLASLKTAEQQAEHREKLSYCPLGRAGFGSEIANAVLFLADNDKSAFTTGQVLFVDGGYTAGKVYNTKK